MSKTNYNKLMIPYLHNETNWSNISFNISFTSFLCSMLRAIPYITSVPLIYLVLCFCFSLNVFSGTHVRTGIGAATP